MVSELSIMFAGLARDCAAALPAVLGNIDRLGSRFKSATAIILENDSVDGTKQILAEWAESPSRTCLTLDGLANIQPRTMRLEFARNALKEAIAFSPESSGLDVVVLIDCDSISERAIDSAQFDSAVQWLLNDRTVSGVFPNQVGDYYDLWALRWKEHCPGDVWEEVLDYAAAHRCSVGQAFEITFMPRIFTIPADHAPVEVDSAFGGLGIYRASAFLGNPNPYLGSKVKLRRSPAGGEFVRLQQCEHVHFHTGLRLCGGRLFILPHLINADTHGLRPIADFARSVPF